MKNITNYIYTTLIIEEGDEVPDESLMLLGQSDFIFIPKSMKDRIAGTEFWFAITLTLRVNTGKIYYYE